MKPPIYPPWRECSEVVGHWAKVTDATPRETDYLYSFGPFVSVNAGHAIPDDGTECWRPAPVIAAPYRVETEDEYECSQFNMSEALDLASKIAGAASFARSSGQSDGH